MKKMIFHGEAIAHQIESLPKGLKKKSAKNGFVVVAESEFSGNDHRVSVTEKVEFYEAEDGTLFAKIEEPTTIGCVIKERHDDVILDAGIWRFDIAKEFDPIEQEVNRVRD